MQLAGRWLAPVICAGQPVSLLQRDICTARLGARLAQMLWGYILPSWYVYLPVRSEMLISLSLFKLTDALISAAL